jgi:hypothetical protein
VSPRVNRPVSLPVSHPDSLQCFPVASPQDLLVCSRRLSPVVFRPPNPPDCPACSPLAILL